MIEALKKISDRFYLALVLWREARGESHACKVAVAFSVLNRVAKPKWWGTDVMTVVTKKWQYSSMTDPKDPQLAKWPQPDDQSWWEAMQIACDILDGVIPKAANPVPGADSYYDLSISPPNWAEPSMFVGQIGRIRFYNVDKDVERT